MEKEITIVVQNAAGEDGLTQACKRGDLFRNDDMIEKYYSQGYKIYGYSIVDEQTTNTSRPQTVVKVIMEK